MAQSLSWPKLFTTNFLKLSSSESKSAYQTMVLDKRKSQMIKRIKSTGQTSEQNIPVGTGLHFYKFAPALEQYCLDSAEQSLPAILNLNIARSARPQRIFWLPNVTKFNIFMNFQIFASWLKIWSSQNFSPRIFWKLSRSESESSY